MSVWCFTVHHALLHAAAAAAADDDDDNDDGAAPGGGLARQHCYECKVLSISASYQDLISCLG